MMADKQPPQIVTMLKPYSGWTALGLFIAALFTSLVAARFMVPIALYIMALCFAVLRYWEEIRTFDFWAFEEWMTTRREALGVAEWHAPHHAAERFCNQVAVRTRNEAAAEMNTIMMEIIRQAPNGHAAPLDFSRPINDANAGRNARYDAAQLRLNQTNALLARELHNYLVRGDLLAKGIPSDGDLGRAERVIPTSRWRVLTLDIAKAQAIGLGWRYSGLVIGVKPKKPNPPPPPSATNKPADEAPRPVKAPPPDARRIPNPPKPSA